LQTILKTLWKPFRNPISRSLKPFGNALETHKKPFGNP